MTTYSDLDDIAYADVLDSRDIIKTLEDWESDLEIAREEAESEPDDVRQELDDGVLEGRVKALREFVRECEGAEDWEFGIELVRDSFFEQYARDLAEDVGAINGEESWPCDHIDWGAAASALQGDYFSAELYDTNGDELNTFWLR